MQIIKPQVTLVWSTPNALQIIEDSARICYRSEADGKRTADDFCRMLIKRQHEAMLEHAVASCDFICDRGISHEIVRHRVASYAMESQRYVDMAKDNVQKAGGISFIQPPDLPANTQHDWRVQMLLAEETYLRLIENGATPQIARSVLPNATATRIRMTANFREWRLFFKLRCATAAHPQMREVANMAREIFKNNWPVIVEDL